MSPDPFAHLHVASGYSLRYGASHPHALVERAAEQEMDTLALTDRDGTYGAVKFAKACLAAGIRPVLGVDVREAMTLVSDGFASTGEGEHRRLLVHYSGFQMSPYADIKPAGEETEGVARILWQRSPGSAG